MIHTRPTASWQPPPEEPYPGAGEFDWDVEHDLDPGRVLTADQALAYGVLNRLL